VDNQFDITNRLEYNIDMKKELAKTIIKKHLWNWKYRVNDIARISPVEMSYDLVVGMPGGKGYRVKVLTGTEDLNKELSLIGNTYDVIALASVTGKKKFAGGAQTVALFTTKHQEVFK